MDTKVCKTCDEEKSYDLFMKRKLSKDGLDLHCKKCKSIYLSKYRKEYRTPEKAKEERVKWPCNKESKKDWNISNRDKRNKRRQEKIENYTDEEYTLFRENVNIKTKSRVDNDILFKLKRNLSSRLNNALKSIKINKNGIKTIYVIGCDISFLKEHIESKFEDWMTWENYGKYNGELYFGWDIDHIIPVSSANNEDEMIILNHYTNLQPLCSKINRYIKKDKIIIK